MRSISSVDCSQLHRHHQGLHDLLSKNLDTTMSPASSHIKSRRSFTGSKRYTLPHLDKVEELVAGNPSQRNWRGIGIALLVIMSICALIAIAVVLLTKDDKDAKVSGTSFNISELLMPKFSLQDPSPMWLSTDLLVYYDDLNGDLLKIDAAEFERAGNVTPQKLIDADVVSSYSSCLVSPDSKFVAMMLVKQKEFRHSRLFKVAVGQILKNGLVGKNKPINDGDVIKLFEWSPSSLPPACAFVDKHNNIWFQKDAFDSSSKIQVTDSGSDDVYHGVADWLYEEEIFETDKSLAFSESGSKLVFTTINDTSVKHVKLNVYTSSNYPRLNSYPYPKVGEKIPTITLNVYMVDLNRTVVLNPPREVQNLKDFYFLHGNWAPSADSSETYIAVWANRVQNISYMCSCRVPNNLKGAVVQCKLHYTQEYMNRWLLPGFTKIFITKRDGYFTILPRLYTDGFFYLHAAFINHDTNSQTTPKFLTSCDWEVTDIVGYHESSHKLFLVAAYPNATSRHLMSVDATASDPFRSVQCVSCVMSDTRRCNYVTALFPKSRPTLYVLKCEGPEIPKTYLRSVADNQTVTVLSNNTKFAAYLAQKLLPVVRYQSVTLPNGYVAQVKFLLPPGVENMAVGDRYPLILRVYGGPSSQMTLDRWSLSFDSYMAATRNFIVAYVDARGSGGRGSMYTSAIYRKLGTVEVDDQIATTRYLLNNTNLIKRNAVAVWGWSYGGFATAHIVKKDTFNTFKCAASVAPVTNFLFYDAAYTERYMGLNDTTDNYDGYQKTIVYNNVTAFLQGKFLLAHGTADDNVHFQNSAVLVEELTKIGAQFQYMAYTNQHHSINERLFHLYTMLDTFFTSCLLVDD